MQCLCCTLHVWTAWCSHHPTSLKILLPEHWRQRSSIPKQVRMEGWVLRQDLLMSRSISCTCWSTLTWTKITFEERCKTLPLLSDQEENVWAWAAQASLEVEECMHHTRLPVINIPPLYLKTQKHGSCFSTLRLLNSQPPWAVTPHHLDCGVVMSMVKHAEKLKPLQIQCSTRTEKPWVQNPPKSENTCKHKL